MNSVEVSRVKVDDNCTVYHDGLVTSGRCIEITETSLTIQWEFPEQRNMRYVIYKASTTISIDSINCYSIIEG